MSFVINFIAACYLFYLHVNT